MMTVWLRGVGTKLKKLDLTADGSLKKTRLPMMTRSGSSSRTMLASGPNALRPSTTAPAAPAPISSERLLSCQRLKSLMSISLELGSMVPGASFLLVELFIFGAGITGGSKH